MSAPRPTSGDPAILLSAAKILAAQMIKHGIDLGNVDEAASQIAACAGWNNDGYRIAKELDGRFYWECDFELCEELDGLGGIVSQLVKEAEGAWIVEHSIVPPFPVGTLVELPRGETGTITGVSEYGHGKYLIAIDGDARANSLSQSRRIVNFEDVKAVAP